MPGEVTAQINEQEKQAVLTLLQRMGQDIKNPQPLLKTMGQYMVSSIDKNFREQGRPEKWAPLSPITLMMRRKGKGGGSPKALMDTGMLRKSITAQVRAHEVVIAPTVRYGIFQQLGARIPVSEKMRKWFHWKGVHLKKETAELKIPARPFMLFQVPQDIDRLQAMVERHVLREARKK